MLISSILCFIFQTGGLKYQLLVSATQKVPNNSNCDNFFFTKSCNPIGLVYKAREYIVNCLSPLYPKPSLPQESGH